jgi:hypothetical protein
MGCPADEAEDSSVRVAAGLGGGPERSSRGVHNVELARGDRAWTTLTTP